MNRIRRNWWVSSGAAVIAIALIIQLVPYGRDQANPPVMMEPAWDSSSTRELAKRACFDCHSNETQWPRYATVAPVSWLVQRDVTKGRAALNFSEWHRPQKRAKDAAEEVLHGEMPKAAYRVMHEHARLSAADMQRLASGLSKTVGVPAAEEQD